MIESSHLRDMNDNSSFRFSIFDVNGKTLPVEFNQLVIHNDFDKNRKQTRS